MVNAMPDLDPALERLIAVLPKVELHLHIEGTLEPEMVFQLARKHGLTLRYPSVDALREAYEFSDLQSFLDIYYASCDVLRERDDFRAMTTAYLRRAAQDRVVHAEIFFDPQTHTARGVPMEAVIGGIRDAVDEAKRDLGISADLILCFLRHLSEDDALATLEQARPFVAQLAGVGLDSGERGNPPSKFRRVFAEARALGLRAVAHAGEEGPAAYIVEALDLLKVERIDHGVRCDQDEELMTRLASEQVPLTVCPLSNIKLRVFDTMADHNLAKLLARGLRVTINSDDPAYFGGYIGDNYRAVAAALPIGAAEVRQLAENAVMASWLPSDRKAALVREIRTTQ